MHTLKGQKMNKPTIKQCFEWSNNLEQSTLFYHHFEAIDWMVGKRGNAKPMTNWKSSLTGWIKRSAPKQSKVEVALANASNNLSDKIWKRMVDLFGTKWTSNYGTHPTPTWIAIIGNLSNERLSYGLRQIIKEGADWPPSMGKFNKMCRDYKQPIKSINSPSWKKIEFQRHSTSATRQREMKLIRSIL